MKTLLIAAVVGLGVFLGLRWHRARQTTSLREDKPAPELPGSSDILHDRPRIQSMFALPTTIAGVAPPWKWSIGDVANIFASNGAGFNKS